MDRVGIFNVDAEVPALPDIEEQAQRADVPWCIDPAYVLEPRLH